MIEMFAKKRKKEGEVVKNGRSKIACSLWHSYSVGRPAGRTRNYFCSHFQQLTRFASANISSCVCVCAKIPAFQQKITHSLQLRVYFLLVAHFKSRILCFHFFLWCKKKIVFFCVLELFCAFFDIGLPKAFQKLPKIVWQLQYFV